MTTTAKKPMTSAERIAKFRSEQKQLGRKQVNVFMTDEEKELVLQYLDKLRGDYSGEADLLVVNSSHKPVVDEIQRILSYPATNPAIKSVDVSLIYRLNCYNTVLNSNPVATINLAGQRFKHLNYD
ncbi:hypothetical protein VQ643_01150 [Pseudomonas sp. F1_0610]|uniref:hypothetical protein n=1 Tax=Pseudomonas sp. F1_0610 TaxID=3114284 RepID=UPI0039C416D8